MSLAHQRCFHHAEREAVARCAECRSFFCRECVTEHGGRLICAACLRELVAVPIRGRPAFLGLMRVLQLAFGFVVAAGFFYWLGQSLLELPSSFHDGTLWRGRWLENTP
jgi:hypothetical protein